VDPLTLTIVLSLFNLFIIITSQSSLQHQYHFIICNLYSSPPCGSTPVLPSYYYFDNPTLKRRYQSFDRVIGIKENAKFQKKDDPAAAIKSIVNISKEKHELKYMYVWHAITGLLGWGPYRSQGDGGIWVNDEVSNGVKGGGGE
jgi:hypothetical protein